VDTHLNYEGDERSKGPARIIRVPRFDMLSAIHRCHFLGDLRELLELILK